jgi:NADH dehydrogenase
MPKRIVVLGAGYAGIEAALSLHKKKKKNDDIEISIIDKNEYHTLLTELHEVAGNRISEEGIKVPLKDIFRYTDVKVIKDEIDNIDFKNNKLLSKSDSVSYSYDYLVLALGSQPNFYGIPGMEEHAFTLWSYDDAVTIREHIKECFRKASLEKNPSKREALLTFVVGGGGFTGVEMIGELGQWVKALCREYGIPRSEIRLMLVEALAKILSNLKDKGIQKSMNYLQNKLKVEVLTNSPITRVGANSVELKTGRVIKTSTLIWTAGVRASCVSDRIECGKNRACRINVNEYAQTPYPNVYAIGDMSAFVADNQTLPALVEAAIQTGKGAAHNIIAEIRGKEKEALKPKLHGVMVSIGSFFAVSDIMGHQFSRLVSIILKYMVNIHYLFGIGGFELVFRYLKHELLEKKQAKFLVENHYSVMTPAFWLVPIRLFLGYSWLMEGIKKVNEGWLTNAMLAGKAADAASSASATETGEKVFRIISDHTPFWYAWIADNIVIPNALVFQVLIVLSEIAIGLALISGTFTFIAGIAALGLNINFLLSTGLYEYNWWYIPAALCMLGGAGRAFGVDHYLIPYLMRQWRYFVRNRRIKPFLFK